MRFLRRFFLAMMPAKRIYITLEESIEVERPRVLGIPGGEIPDEEE